MNNIYAYRFFFCCGIALCWMPAQVQAQALTITSVSPVANARAAARTGSVTVSFSQPLAAASAAALQVFSSQRGGRRTGPAPAVVSGRTLSFAPTSYPFLPGEEVQVIVTTAAAGSGGALGRPRVVQFTAATGGTGQANFLPSAASPDIPYYTSSIARNYGVFDFEGDGDLDLVVPMGVAYGSCSTCGSSTTIALYVNDGNGRFTAVAPIVITLPGVSVFRTEGPIRVGDVDGDGDLDFMLEGNMGTWFLNNGSGTFTIGNSSGATGRVMVTGDLDGDGDLDVIGVNSNGSNSVSLNDGLGSFTAATGFASADSPLDASLGDVDGDGDLDLVTIVRRARPGSPGGTVYLNNGSGSFTAGPTLALDSEAFRLGDVDGDGDLDLLATNYGSTVSIRLNDGLGNFIAPAIGAEVTVGINPGPIALGDLDGDGDLDFVTCDTGQSGVGSVSVMLNDGTGIFAPPATNPIPVTNTNVISDRTELCDIDGDGDLDMLILGLSSSQLSSASIFIRLNQPSGVLATAESGILPAFTLAPNPAHDAVLLTGAVAQTPVEIFDLLGRIVLSDRVDAIGKAQLLLPVGLPAGLYLVRNTSHVCRLVVE